MNVKTDEWMTDVEGNFLLHTSVVQVMPKGVRVSSAESCGVSAWTKTAKISVILPDGSPQRYFLKVSTGTGSRPSAEGEYESALAIGKVVPGFVPVPVGWGEYHDGESHFYFYLGEYHDMDLRTPPDPEPFVAKVAELHTRGKSPTGIFGFSVPTVCGIFERPVEWDKSWANCFASQLKKVIEFDNETNGTWLEFDLACKQIIDAVIPRLLGALQSDGRSIEPALIHGSLWEQNIGVDMATGETIVFDPGSTYAHNEMEFGTWRGSWAYYFNSPVYTRLYQRHVEPSEPVEEWDDRNRLYSLHPSINDSAGHPGSISRSLAYNDMLFLCEKYAPLEGLGSYNHKKDISVTRAYVQHPSQAMEMGN